MSNIPAQKIPLVSKVNVLGILNLKKCIYLYYQSSKDSKDTFSVAKSEDGFSFERQAKQAQILLGKFTHLDVSKYSNFCFSEQNRYFDVILAKNATKSPLEVA